MISASPTLVIQSHRAPLPYAWLEQCMSSVQRWCNEQNYEYRFIGDGLFEVLPDDILDNTKSRRVIATDLARLMVIRNFLSQGYARLVWLDADFLIINTKQFVLPDKAYAVGREVWIQKDQQGKLKSYKKVHNAFLMFCQNNAFLDFYIETASRMLRNSIGNVPPQFIGPKLLTALHNVVDFPVMECAGMLSPLVIKDLLQGGGEALALFEANSPQPITGANLCTSSCEKGALSDEELFNLIEVLCGDSRA